MAHEINSQFKKHDGEIIMNIKLIQLKSHKSLIEKFGCKPTCNIM